MAHGHKFDWVCVQRSLNFRLSLELSSVNHQVARQFRSRKHGIVGDDDITAAVVEHTNDASVLHRPASKVAHASSRSLAEEILALQGWQRRPYLFYVADGWERLDFVVDERRDVDGDVPAVALGPPFLPEISGHFRNLADLVFQSGTAV